MNLTLEAIAWLILRLTFAGVYLYAAYQNTRFFKSYTVPETELLYRGTSLAANKSFVMFSAAAGLAIMYVGAIAIALGIAAEVGGLLLGVFTALGIVIHRHRWKDAQSLAEKSTGDAAAMGWSAYSGHFSSALKNVALIGCCAFFAICGAGPSSVCLWRLWGVANQSE